ncbi:Ig-like domain-containing protein [Haloarchaeobius sp. HRN-SO-5]|uniref:thermonuclease family protein n=1 Tax=Haloarchaeobius sp. HRN-SO-5 TaxID=3446118 RepID=UPI003EC024E9
MRRRDFLTTVVTAVGGIALGSNAATAADTQLEPGTWYDATVTDVTDGDTIDVTLDSDGTEYEIRTLGHDSPETRRNGQYEEVREWEGIEDDKHLSTWGENAKDYAQTEFPDGTSVQIAVDENEDELDPFGRLLAYIRYDKSGDGSMDTLYNEDLVRQGYARVYSSSLTKHDQIWQAEHEAQADGVGVWSQHDPENTTEVDNDPVSTVFFPNASSVRTDSGAIDPSRVPVFAESTAYQSLDSGAVDYTDVPMVGVDEANNLALVGGLFINEEHEGDAVGEHQVFLSNLADYLSSKTGQVLVEGSHRQFNATHALSCEDAVVYQRFLEGVGLPFEGINSFDGSGDNALSTARSIIVTNPPQAFTTGEVDALSTFISNGGSVVLLGSALASATARSNLDALAADLGSDLRLNADQVFDDDNNTGDSAFVTTGVFDTTFPLFDAYTPDSGSSNASPSCSIASPSDGATVSGTTTVQVSAADSEDAVDSLTVEVAIDGGTWQPATYDSTSGYYEYDWDTTGVSDGDHTIDARATDSAGATTNASQVTVTVDNVASAPTVDSLSVGEVETSDADAEFDVSWDVGDSDGDLSSVDLTLTDDTAGATDDTATVSVSGSDASGTTRLVAPDDDGSGNSYTVDCTVSDSGGSTGSDSTTVTEGEPTSDGPTVDSISLTEQNGGGDPHAEFDGDWSVSDPDGDLDRIEATLTDLDDGETEYTDTVSIAGSSESGTENMEARKEENSGHTYEFEVVVYDAAGNSASATAEEVEDGV